MLRSLSMHVRAHHLHPPLECSPRFHSRSCSELIREMFVAPEGSVLVGYDADALELRMLAHYLAAYEYGRCGCGVWGVRGCGMSGVVRTCFAMQRDKESTMRD